MNDNIKDILEVVAHSVIIFLIVVGIPFMISGVWPPFVSVLSESMEPNINTNDMVFVIDNERYTDDELYGGIYTMEHNSRSAFGQYGDVIVFYRDGDENSIPVLHRAAFTVSEDEDWTDRADSTHIQSNNCDEVRNCPAPHDGVITLGDNNTGYDQASGLSEPVKEEWVIGRAKYRVPSLGTFRNIIEAFLA